MNARGFLVFGSIPGFLTRLKNNYILYNMDIKIHIFSSTNSIGKEIFFVYKTGKNEGYACATLDWSKYLMDKYRVFEVVNKSDFNFMGKFGYLPYNEIETIIKRRVKAQSNIDVDNITYCYKNKIDNFIENTKDYVYSTTS